MAASPAIGLMASTSSARRGKYHSSRSALGSPGPRERRIGVSSPPAQPSRVAARGEPPGADADQAKPAGEVVSSNASPAAASLVTEDAA